MARLLANNSALAKLSICIFYSHVAQNKIGDEGIVAIAKALESNTNLTNLLISSFEA